MEPVYFIDPESEEDATDETLEEWMEIRNLPTHVREYFREQLERQKKENKLFWESQKNWNEYDQERREIALNSSISMFIQKLICNTDNGVIFKNNPNHQNNRYIPTAVKREVWRRDQGKCIYCGSNIKLEYDHIIPLSKGGSNTARNIQLLCEICNRLKSANIE